MKILLYNLYHKALGSLGTSKMSGVGLYYKSKLELKSNSGEIYQLIASLSVFISFFLR